MTAYYTIRNNKIYIQGTPHDKKDCRRIFINGKSAGIDTKEEVNRSAKQLRSWGYKVSIRKM